MEFPRQEWTGCHFLLQGIFLTQGLNLSLLHWQVDSLLLSHLGSPTMEYSVQFSCSVMSYSLWPRESQHARPPCPSPTPRVHSDSRPSSQWCHPSISSSVVPFFSCPQSLPASESFPMSHLFTCIARCQTLRIVTGKKKKKKNSDWQIVNTPQRQRFMIIITTIILKCVTCSKYHNLGHVAEQDLGHLLLEQGFPLYTPGHLSWTLEKYLVYLTEFLPHT